MREGYTKSIIVQWLVPLGVLVTIIGIMLVNFSVTSVRTETKEVEKQLEVTAQEYAEKFNNNLEYLMRSGIPMAAFMESYKLQDAHEVSAITNMLYLKTDAYAIILTDMNGMGIDHKGKTISLASNHYFAGFDRVKRGYCYAEDDGYSGRPAVILSIPLKDNNETRQLLLMYYDLEKFSELVKKVEFDGMAFYSVIAQDGTVIASTGGLTGKHAENQNLWEEVTEESKTNLNKARERMRSGLTGVVAVQTVRGEKSVVYAPIGINNWYMIIEVNQDYVDSMLAKEWNPSKNMILKIVVAMCIFLGMIVVINIAIKIYDNEKKRDLVNKADTDLLTDLTNKVATERLIKEYIEEHPDEQAAMLVFDIDNFKKINDTMGHAFGDEVLHTLGIRIRAEFRVSDIVGRTGGDEFMILLKNLKDDALIEKEARRLERFFHDFQAGEYVKYSVTASIGCAVYPKDGEDFQSLYIAADSALYLAKKRGKNQLAFYRDIQ